MPHDAKTETGIWYFAYGSNMRLPVMERRGIRPMGSRVAMVPSHALTFDVFGVPYSEPAMASIAPRLDAGAAAARYSGSSGPQLAPPPPVHGVAYLLADADFQNLIVSEGAGIAYSVIELKAQVLSDGNGDVATPTTLLVHTLAARFPFRPNRRPSVRYLSLLVEGARENNLPGHYQGYLETLSCYKRPPTNSKLTDLGIRCFLSFWMVVISAVMRRIKASVGTSGRAPPAYLGYLVAGLFRVMWCYHDWIHRPICGDGGCGSERTWKTHCG